MTSKHHPPESSTIDHQPALNGLTTLTARVQYACVHVIPPVTVHAVREWLADQGHPTDDGQRSFVSRIVNAWRKDRGLGDTADQLSPLTPERLAELDAIASTVADEKARTDRAPASEPPDVQTSGSPDVKTSDPVPDPARSRGSGGFYLVALIATLISINTSWRFFGDILHIDNQYERGAMFGVLEIALVACGYAMRAGVRRSAGTPGPARMLAWALCAMSAYMAVALSGPVEGIARVTLGPALALIALHLALGIEIRVRRGRSTGAWARVGRELRERSLSRLGLADDDRDALARTRDRAADRAARLATATRTPFRRRRLARAVRISNAALDDHQRGRVVAQVAAMRNLDDLVTLKCPSPWTVGQ